MWDSFQTKQLGGMVAGITTMTGGGGDPIETYVARPDGNGPYPGVVLIHHAPGWDEFYQEFARRFANHGFIAVAPNLYSRFGGGTPPEATAAMRAAGGVSDDSVVADSVAAVEYLKGMPQYNGKAGVIGSCSGGRHAVLTASRSDSFSAVVDLWGGGVVQSADQLTPQQPVAPIDLTPNLNVPLLGLFGNDDQRPNVEQVNQHEEALKQYGKDYTFHRYDGAGHGFFYYHAQAYRPQAAMDGWDKVEAFFNQHLR